MMPRKIHPSSIPECISLVFWMILCGLRLSATWQNTRVIPFLLAVQSGTVVWLLITRNEQVKDAHWSQKTVAWISALLPLAVRLEQETPIGQAITILGLILVVWSMMKLGGSFGIAPADRGLVKDGPYGYIRHPMYLGELISLSGVMICNLSTWNVILIAVLLLSLLYRIHWEELAINGYMSFAGQVRWRLIPRIW